MRRLFLLVTAVVLVDTAFFAAITPLLPHYSDELGLSKTAAGVLAASYAAGTLVGSLPGGWLATRWGVKRTLLLGLTTMSVTSVVFGLAENVVVLDLARFVQGLGGACSWAASMAWLISDTPVERRGELIGSVLAAAIIGVLLGPVLGGTATVLSPEAVFSGIAVLGAGLVVWAWATPSPPPAPDAVLNPLAALRTPALALGFWLFMLPSLFSGVIEVLVPLRLDELGAAGVTIGGVFLVAAGLEAIVSPLSGRLSDRRGRLLPIRVGLAAATGVAVLLPLPEAVALEVLALLAVVAALGMLWAPAMAVVSEASDDAGLDQALAFAIANLAWSGGHLLGSGAGGAVAEATSDAVPYVLMAVVCGVTAVATRNALPRLHTQARA